MITSIFLGPIFVARYVMGKDCQVNMIKEGCRYGNSAEPVINFERAALLAARLNSREVH